MSNQKMEHILIIGSGSMGGGMASLFSEHGSNVSIYDTNSQAVQGIIDTTKQNAKLEKDQVQGFTDFEAFINSSPKEQVQRIIVLSLPHGSVVDDLIDKMEPLMAEGDIVIDCGNEWWESTERRQKRAETFRNGAISWLGVGVSGGYQAARRGPSMSPGGDKQAFEKVKHLLEAWAAKDKNGTPCVQYLGTGGSGHMVKCLHNGIEQGELGAICEVYTLLRSTFEFGNDEIGKIFEKWNKTGGLAGNYLQDIGAQITHFKRGDGIINNKGIVDDIEDKVTQDADDSEGTGVWSLIDSSRYHVAAPTLAAAHYLRLISANRGERVKVLKALNIPQPETASKGTDKNAFVDKLHDALYCSILVSFIQGLNVIARANKEKGWGVSLEKCIQIWRAGCIIQSDAIADLLEPIYKKNPTLINLLLDEGLCSELRRCYPALKDVVRLSLEVDAVIPSLSASLEYLKAVGGRHLPTAFEETEMDYFGHHNYDLISEHKGEPQKGSHHTEFKPA